MSKYLKESVDKVDKSFQTLQNGVNNVVNSTVNEETKENISKVSGQVAQEIVEGGVDYVEATATTSKQILIDSLNPLSWTWYGISIVIMCFAALFWITAMCIPFYNPHIQQWGFGFWMMSGIAPFIVIVSHMLWTRSNAVIDFKKSAPSKSKYIHIGWLVITIATILAVIALQGYFIHVRAITSASSCSYRTVNSTDPSGTENNATFTSYDSPFLCVNDVKFNTSPRAIAIWAFAALYMAMLVLLLLVAPFYFSENARTLLYSAIAWVSIAVGMEQSIAGNGVGKYTQETFAKKMREKYRKHYGKDDEGMLLLDRQALLSHHANGNKKKLKNIMNKVEKEYETYGHKDLKHIKEHHEKVKKEFS